MPISQKQVKQFRTWMKHQIDCANLLQLVYEPRLLKRVLAEFDQLTRPARRARRQGR